MNRFAPAAFAALAVVASLPPAYGATNDAQIEALRKEIQQDLETVKQQYEARIKALEERLQKAESSAPPTVATASTLGISGAAGAFQLGVNILGVGGGSSVGDSELGNLQAGGHDPNRNGFTVQNIELTATGAVDPYFDGQLSLVALISSEGETEVELEEAFLRTRALPWGLQIKAGQFFTEFGRLNSQHPHSWDFVDQPVINSRLFGGDGLRSQGVRVSWLLPASWYSELYFGAQNAKGETVQSFLFDEASEIGGYTLAPGGGARGANDLLFNARWLNGFDLTDSTSVNAGLSALRGPNATGSATSTAIYGADLYVKWKSVLNQRGFPFAAWQTEFLRRNYEAVDSVGVGLPDTTLRDQGYYTQLVWGFQPGWVAGLRYEHADGNDPNGNAASDPLRDDRTRISPNLTFYPTEFSKIRLQYNRDRAEFLPGRTADSLWLQFEIGLGSHSAHKF
ncbi:MAG: hypothetical protein ACSLE5_04655 [Porticoccaceae bacterium]